MTATTAADRPLTAAPCRECGDTAGYIPPQCQRPWRGRGRCKRCYARAHYRGALGLHTGPCLSCGPGRSLLARGLCGPCYSRAVARGVLARYPACGRVPVAYAEARFAKHPDPIPAGQSPILRPDPAQPVWTGLALAKYPAPTWHTLRPTTPDGWRFAATDDARRAA
jgi:hypothetical protein